MPDRNHKNRPSRFPFQTILILTGLGLCFAWAPCFAAAAMPTIAWALLASRSAVQADCTRPMRTTVVVGEAGRSGLFIPAMVRQESRNARTSFLPEG